jgi:hypothetical protein
MQTRHIINAAVASSFILLGSCASMKLGTVTTPMEPPIAATVRGAGLVVSPPVIQLSASRPEFDLRGVTMEVQGQRFSLGGRYLETIDDMDLGRVGVLDTNIFKKAQIDVAALSTYAGSRIVDGISGRTDIRILVNRDKPDIGEYSSRPLVYDFSKYPWVGTFDPQGRPLPALFGDVSAGSVAAGNNYLLSVTLTIRSEIYEILQDDVNVQNKYLTAPHKPGKGDYYLDFLSYAAFSLKDRSGKVVMDEKTPQAFPTAYTRSRQLYLPVKNRDADAYANYFRSYDFNADAKAIVDEIVDAIIPAFRPLYRNLNQYVAVEEGK